MKRCLLLALALFLITGPLALADDEFPFTFTPEENVPGWARFRAEGRTLAQCLPFGVHYATKASRMKRTAPAEEIAYFRRQTASLQRLQLQDREDASRGRLTTFGMAGDIMWIRNGWEDFLGADALEFMRGFDFWIGNLETPISRSSSVPEWVPACHHFNSRPELITAFRRADGTSLFRALGFANNHVIDKGEAGARETLAFLHGEKILTSGLNVDPGAKPYVTFASDGVRFGFYSAGWGLNDPHSLARMSMKMNIVPGLAFPNAARIDLSGIKAALEGMSRENVDLKIISLHWGHEYELYPDPEQVKLARAIVTLGADIIMGHHPHVIQPMEAIAVNGYQTEAPLPRIDDGTELPRKALILYSLGNFTTAMRGNDVQVGRTALVEVFRNAAGRIDWRLSGTEDVYNERNDSARGNRHKFQLLRNASPR